MTSLRCHACLIVAQFIFAMNMIIARAAFKESPRASPLVFALGRGVLALIAFTIIHIFYRARGIEDNFVSFSSRDKLKCYGLGFCGVTLNLIGVVYGVKLTDAITSGAFQCAIPPVSFFVSFLAGTDNFSSTKVLSLMLAVGGNCLMARVWMLKDEGTNLSYFVGCALLVLNVTAYSMFLVLQKPFVCMLPKLEFLFRANLSGVSFMVLIAATSVPLFVEQLSNGSITPTCWGAIAFAGLINSVVPYYLVAVGLSEASPVIAALYFALQPIFVAIMSYVLLGEGLTFVRALGGCFVLGGLLVGSVPFPSFKNKPVAEAPTNNGMCVESPRHGEILDEMRETTEALQFST